MKTVSLAIALLLVAGQAIAQNPSEHQQHQSGASTPAPQPQAFPGATSTQPSATPGQAQTTAPSGPMTGGMHGMMQGQGQSGSGMMMGGHPGMMMSCPPNSLATDPRGARCPASFRQCLV